MESNGVLVQLLKSSPKFKHIPLPESLVNPNRRRNEQPKQIVVKTEEEQRAEEEKIRKKREINRLAAAKSRQKHLRDVKHLSEEIYRLEEEQKELYDLRATLQQERENLKQTLLFHISMCPFISQEDFHAKINAVEEASAAIETRDENADSIASMSTETITLSSDSSVASDYSISTASPAHVLQLGKSNVFSSVTNADATDSLESGEYQCYFVDEIPLSVIEDHNSNQQQSEISILQKALISPKRTKRFMPLAPVNRQISTVVDITSSQQRESFQLSDSTIWSRENVESQIGSDGMTTTRRKRPNFLELQPAFKPWEVSGPKQLVSDTNLQGAQATTSRSDNEGQLGKGLSPLALSITPVTNVDDITTPRPFSPEDESNNIFVRLLMERKNGKKSIMEETRELIFGINEALNCE